MTWKKRTVSALLAGAMSVTLLSTGALASRDFNGYDKDAYDLEHTPSYSSDYELVKATKYDAKTNAVVGYTDYENNSAGKITKGTSYFYDDNGEKQYSDTTTYLYDSAGRLSGKDISYNYWDVEIRYTRDSEGNITSEVIDNVESLITYTYEYDTHNQIVKKEGCLEWSDTSKDPIIDSVETRKNEYDSNGNLVKQEFYYTKNGETNAGNWYTYEYDDNNRLIERVLNSSYGDTASSRTTEQFTYDANGNEAYYYDDDSYYTVYQYQKTNKLAVSTVFKDISANAWYTNAVQYVYDNGIMKGMSDDTFAPSTSMTRAMVAQIMYAQAGSPAVSGDMPFTDVPAGKWYYDAVLWATQNSVVAGMGDGTFAPNSNITRQEYAAILYRYEKSPAVSGSLNFPDADTVSSWAKDAVLWANQNGIISGTANNGVTLLDPKGTATRAQSAMILMNYLEK